MRPPPPPPAHKLITIFLYIYFLQDIAIGAPPPLPVIKIVKYCDVWGGGGRWQNSAKNNGAPSLCH